MILARCILQESVSGNFSVPAIDTGLHPEPLRAGVGTNAGIDLALHPPFAMKVDAAAREGTSWDLLRAELTRDHSSIFDNLLQIEERLGAEAMKKRDSTEK